MLRSDCLSKMEPSSAIKDFLLILLNKNSVRNTIATKMKIDIAINVTSINLVIITLYLS